MLTILLAVVVLAAILLMRSPRDPGGPPASRQLEAHLLAMDRRHKQLRKDHLSDW